LPRWSCTSAGLRAARRGSSGLVLLKAATVLAAFLLAWRHLRTSGVPAATSWLLIGLIAIPAANRTTTFRPQVFSFLLFVSLLVLLAAWERHRRAVWFVPGVFLLWANTHGAWIVGAGSYAVWTAVRSWSATTTDRRRLALIALLSAAATLTTPYGFGGWSFLTDTVGPGRPDIADWVPPWHEAGLLLAWLLPGSALAWAVSRRPRPDAGWTAIALVLAVFSLKVSRVDIFFGVAVAWVLASRYRRAGAVAPRAAAQPALPNREIAGKAMIAVAVAVLLVGPMVTAAARNLTCVPLDPASRSYPDAAATRFIREHLPPGRLFVFFDYGEYVIWHLAGHLRVSIDGRRETVYSDDLILGHAAFFANPSQHAAYPERLNADYVWLPNELGAAAALEARGWTPAFSGRLSTVWSRRQRNYATHVGGGADTLRCFPGP
jgi:hypothetical protein